MSTFVFRKQKNTVWIPLISQRFWVKDGGSASTIHPRSSAWWKPGGTWASTTANFHQSGRLADRASTSGLLPGNK
jgi:hypothetical protein